MKKRVAAFALILGLFFIPHIYGRIVAYIQATEAAGDAEISFTSPWLKESKVSVKIQ